MRQVSAKWFILVGMSFAVAMADGCRRGAREVPAAADSGAAGGSSVPLKAAPAENRIQVPAKPEPVVGDRVRRNRGRRVPAATAPVERQPTVEETDAHQRLEDQKLLQQQEAASKKMQEENDQQVERYAEEQRKMQEEQRIQEIPETGPTETAQPAPAAPQQ